MTRIILWEFDGQVVGHLTERAQNDDIPREETATLAASTSIQSVNAVCSAKRR